MASCLFYITDIFFSLICYELPSMQTLDDFLKMEKQLTEETVYNIVNDLIGAVDYISSKQIVHNAILPENIILVQSQQVKKLCIQCTLPNVLTGWNLTIEDVQRNVLHLGTKDLRLFTKACSRKNRNIHSIVTLNVIVQHCTNVQSPSGPLT